MEDANLHIAMRPKRYWRVSFGVLALTLPGFVRVASGSPEVASPVRFHQDWLATRRGERDAPHRRAIVPPVTAPDFDDPRSVLMYILGVSPAEPVVHPSERYYYYEFALGARVVAGNIRFTDAESGEIGVGYFDRLDRSAMRWAMFSEENGVGVEMSGDGERVTVNAGGVSRVFRLDRSPFGNEADAGLLESERYVSGVLDESGFYLHLIYSPEHRAFYYTLQSNRRQADSLVRLDLLTALMPDGLSVLVGAESRFVFLRDESLDRTVLVGVRSSEIAENSYFDGPFDQVPPHLPLRLMLAEAYPYVTYGGGIDEHGRFLGRVGQRVAISPYFDYTDLDAMRDRLSASLHAAGTGVDRWIGVVLEDKRDFHLRLEGSASTGFDPASYEHAVNDSRSWPPGHWLQQSSTLLERIPAD